MSTHLRAILMAEAGSEEMRLKLAFLTQSHHP
jgi:hypothetical protein